MATDSFHLPSTTLLRLAVAAAAACFAPAALAQAALPPGVGVYLTNTVVGIGGSSYASSNTVTIYSGGGLSYDQPSGFSYGLTSPTMPLGLTTATLSSIGTNTPYGYATGEARATADLAGGVVGGSTTSSADVPYREVGPVAARVETTSLIRDYLTFSVASAAGADVTVTAHLGGSIALGDPNYANGDVRMAVNLGGYFTYYEYEDTGGTFSGAPGAVLGDFSSYSFTNETPSGFDFTGVFHVTDQERVPFSLGLYLDCSYSTCDFGNAGRIGLSTPDGVSYTSDSGVFLTGTTAVAPVPEPETWALLAAGFGALASVARRRREKRG